MNWDEVFATLNPAGFTWAWSAWRRDMAILLEAKP